MIKVLYIVSTLQRTGPTNQLYNIIKFLDRNKFAPFILSLSDEPKDTRRSDFKALNIDMQNLKLSRIEGLFLAKKRILEIINNISPDIVHTQGIRADSLISGISVKKVCTVHCFPEKDYTMTYGLLQGKLMVLAHTKAMKKFDCCIGVSSAVSNNIRELYSIKRTHTVPNGVDTDLFFPVTQKEKDKLRTEYSLPIKGRIWISTGHLSSRKDPTMLIKAWKNGIASENDHLLLLGDGPLRQSCEKEASGHKNIHILGRVKNVRDYLALSDFFVSSSKAEGLPMAVIEAMACGLPVLLSDIPPHAELFEKDKDIGNFFVIGSTESFKAELLEITKKPYKILQKNALSLIKEKYNAAWMSECYQKIYSKIVREKQ